mmetsp:Transcript_62420/g.71604  ORF Transcript_62420/g.71604 Transcript_62420/m.71604 type:complete len:93 (-) Transcript_62420:298-576(-)
MGISWINTVFVSVPFLFVGYNVWWAKGEIPNKYKEFKDLEQSGEVPRFETEKVKDLIDPTAKNYKPIKWYRDRPTQYADAEEGSKNKKDPFM